MLNVCKRPCFQGLLFFYLLINHLKNINIELRKKVILQKVLKYRNNMRDQIMT